MTENGITNIWGDRYRIVGREMPPDKILPNIILAKINTMAMRNALA